MAESDEERPDGRRVTSETHQLRQATRELRLHLDELPIDYRPDVSGDRFLAGLAFMFARQRYACAESLIGAGFGGTVIGSMARSLFVDGLRWLWIGDEPDRRRALLGDLRDERNRLCILLEQTDATLGNEPRWLMPLPDIADLTGQSMSWLDVPALPNENELLDDFLSRRGVGSSPGNVSEHAQLLRRTRELLDMSGLRGAVMVLAHAGHGNYLGLLSSFTDDGAAGHDLRADHEALFMQVASVGVAATLIGTAAAVPELWPADVPRQAFLERAVELAAGVTATAVPLHRLDTARRPVPQRKGRSAPSRQATLLRPGVVQPAGDLPPGIDAAQGVVQAAETYYQSVKSMRVNPWDCGQPTLHAMLAYGGGHSNLEAVMATYDQPGSSVIAVFAARMLLEEAARMAWRYSVGDWQKFKERAKQYFDEFRARQQKTINTLIGSGVPRSDAIHIFARPKNVLIVTPDDEIARNRKPLPTIGSMLRDLGDPFPEPGWLEVAYSLLSQITHSTPIGHLHTTRFRHGVGHGNELSPEMLGLSIDVACLGSAHLIGLSARLLTDNANDAAQYHNEIIRHAAAVHSIARLVHGLD
ncbi:hypothetical protein E1293_08015 [Actinomadura darangshiensis]|uniref:Uncharacterized protein n=1 Tax=Actinomadura darangshiensis TaxID=705336 RepID=A0A4R5BKY6_9ACTN|nr:hypothetical protein [Actinomadura darangshiensis]TDD87341.1 hypothetical protein E1293_08015 [Actinomadura darangshiensis]